MKKFESRTKMGTIIEESIVYCNLIESQPGRFHHANGTEIKLGKPYQTVRNKRKYHGFYVKADKEVALKAPRARKEVVVQCVIPVHGTYFIHNENNIATDLIIFKKVIS